MNNHLMSHVVTIPVSISMIIAMVVTVRILVRLACQLPQDTFVMALQCAACELEREEDVVVLGGEQAALLVGAGGEQGVSGGLDLLVFAAVR